jgi:hypothetical protein
MIERLAEGDANRRSADSPTDQRLALKVAGVFVIGLRQQLFVERRRSRSASPSPAGRTRPPHRADS